MSGDRTSDLRRRKMQLYRARSGLTHGLPIPEGPMEDRQLMRFLEELVGRVPPDFALAFGASRRIVELGLFGHVIMSCGNLREVLDVWLGYAYSAGELVRIEAQVDPEPGGAWIVDLIPSPLLEPDVRRFAIEELSATFFAFCHDVTGGDFSEFSVEIGHPARPGVDYAAFIPGPIKFGARRNRIAGPAAVLDLPVAGSDPETRDVLLRRFVAGSAFGGEGAGPVETALMDYLVNRGARMPTEAGAAAAMGMSKRTLVLKLAGEGTSYSAVLNAYRRHYALALLSEGGLCTKQIAHAVGFRHQNSLRRAYRGWTGRSLGSARPG